jgi:hypothetical protein
MYRSVQNVHVEVITTDYLEAGKSNPTVQKIYQGYLQNKQNTLVITSSAPSESL